MELRKNFAGATARVLQARAGAWEAGEVRSFVLEGGDGLRWPRRCARACGGDALQSTPARALPSPPLRVRARYHLRQGGLSSAHGALPARGGAGGGVEGGPIRRSMAPLVRAPRRSCGAAARSRCVLYHLGPRARHRGALPGSWLGATAIASPHGGLRADGAQRHLRTNAHQPADCFKAVLHCLPSTLSEFQPWPSLASATRASSALQSVRSGSLEPSWGSAARTGPAVLPCSAPRARKRAGRS